jgi:superfamily II DNA or RNA helicase
VTRQLVDEFHHAAASSYERWLAHQVPSLLRGLTATPERSGGEDILHWFEGRNASDLRLQSALDQGLLCPFHYFGLYTANDARLRLILQELVAKVTHLASMRALGFCVSVEHARWMAGKFVAAGLRAVCTR